MVQSDDQWYEYARASQKKILPSTEAKAVQLQAQFEFDVDNADTYLERAHVELQNTACKQKIFSFSGEMQAYWLPPKQKH